MPVYEYRCGTCGALFSTLVRRIGDDVAPACPTCGSAAQRTLSRFAYHRSLKMQLEQLDPTIDRELDAADTLTRDPLDRLPLDGIGPVPD